MIGTPAVLGFWSPGTLSFLREGEFGPKPLRLAKARQRVGPKEKRDDKMRRRQGKIGSTPAEAMPEMFDDLSLTESTLLD